jgi:hypothetical protein
LKSKITSKEKTLPTNISHTTEDLQADTHEETLDTLSKNNEKYFSEKELESFFSKPHIYSSCKCILDRTYMRHTLGYRSCDSTKLFENVDAFFAKDRSTNTFIFRSGEICDFNSVYAYSVESDVFTINWGTHESLFELYEKFEFNIKIKRRDQIGEKLYDMIDQLISYDWFDDQHSFGIKVHYNAGENNDCSTSYILLDDIKDNTLKEYFNFQEQVLTDIWQNTILMKCFDTNPDVGLESDSCQTNSKIGQLNFKKVTF